MFRIIFISTILCGFLVHCHWKASFIGHISIFIPESPISNLREILDTQYQITLVKDSSYQAMFQEADDEPMRSIWRTRFKNKAKSLLSTPEEMVKLVLTGEYAMYETFAAFQSLEEMKDCLIADVGFHVVKMDFAFPVMKTSPYTGVLNYMLRKMVESGILKRLRITSSSLTFISR